MHVISKDIRSPSSLVNQQSGDREPRPGPVLGGDCDAKWLLGEHTLLQTL